MNKTFDYLLSLVIAHSLLLEAKNTYSPSGIVDDCLNGDPPAQSVGESTDAQLQAYIKNLPGLAQTTSAQVLPTEQALQDAQNKLAPQQADLQAQLYAKYGPQLAQIGDLINANSAKAGAASDLSVLQGPGSQLLDATQQAQQKLDPEYYATRAATGKSLQDLLGSINLNGLSGSERSEVERSNAQQDASRGIANSPSQTATTQNAMNFGTALQGKRNALTQAIGAATSFLPSSQGPISAFQVATGKPAGNSGTTTPGSFAANTNIGNTATSLGTSLLGNINSTSTNAANIDANRRDVLDRVNGTVSSLPSC